MHLIHSRLYHRGTWLLHRHIAHPLTNARMTIWRLTLWPVVMIFNIVVCGLRTIQSSISLPCHSKLFHKIASTRTRQAKPGQHILSFDFIVLVISTNPAILVWSRLRVSCTCMTSQSTEKQVLYWFHFHPRLGWIYHVNRLDGCNWQFMRFGLFMLVVSKCRDSLFLIWFAYFICNDFSVTLTRCATSSPYFSVSALFWNCNLLTNLCGQRAGNFDRNLVVDNDVW